MEITIGYEKGASENRLQLDTRNGLVRISLNSCLREEHDSKRVTRQMVFSR